MAKDVTVQLNTFFVCFFLKEGVTFDILLSNHVRLQAKQILLVMNELCPFALNSS